MKYCWDWHYEIFLRDQEVKFKLWTKKKEIFCHYIVAIWLSTTNPETYFLLKLPEIAWLPFVVVQKDFLLFTLFWACNFSTYTKAKLFLETMFFVIIFTYLQVQNGNGVLNRLVPCLKCIELACWVLQATLDLCY